MALIPLLPASFVQLRHDSMVHVFFDFDHNGIAHLLIIAAIFILFTGAMKRLKE